MSGVVQSLDGMIESMLGDIDYPVEDTEHFMYPFKVRCGVVKRRPPRHKFFELIIDAGREDIDRVFKGEGLRSGDGDIDLLFVFPERWMGVKEQQDFMAVLVMHPDVERIRSVDILTSSPIIVGSFRRQQVRILTWEDDG